MALIACGTLLAACQVHPLYSDTNEVQQSLGAIAYSDATTRVEQEVRNKLIFLTGGGAGEPAKADYEVDIKVTTKRIGVLLERASDTPMAGRVTVSADYTLRRASDGTVLKAGHRSAVALVDYPDQEFAKIRTIRDAENRAADELAELIRADLAMALGR
ncbi:LPS assembly lipoprotein LptE [Rhizobiaceae bacterium n13]|uniref:LPS assembly lipoprotein LptE n=2 Tax=Ferirhizobium litorale TaxID=2927786 RepID=A0AAE3QFX6_9HYPH|nr:LPS assembly lipoprotein LptE [Fererhizobium litorale]MDI7863058.1 LPS assembly lipoprotein LptE [Fererhizobium litorale]MDI7923265.1 LPS assembly lipoprotein LptE [Fererhizobium litorale]